MGKYLVIIGLVITAAGLIFMILPKIPFIGRLPGDILLRKDDFTFYFPLTTSIILSVVISLVLYFIGRR